MARLAPGNPPEAVIVVRQTGRFSFDFDGSESTSQDGGLSYDWDFGDGNASAQEAPSHSYAAEGEYTVTLIVTDAGGGVDSDSATVTVSGQWNPTAPGPLNLDAVDSFSAVISWQPSASWPTSSFWVGRLDYQIFRDGALVGSVSPSTTSFTDTSVAAGSSHVYAVRARSYFIFTGWPFEGPFSQELTVEVPVGPVLDYDFDADSGAVVLDQSGLGNDGSLFDDATLLGPAGNRVASFDGENDRINVGLPASLDLTGDMTMSAWVLPDALDANDWRYYNVLARGYYLEPDRSQGIEVFLRINRGEAQVGHWYGDFSQDQVSSPIATDRLVHLVGVHDTGYANSDGSVGAWLLYVDGSLRGTTPSTQAPASIGGEWAVGGRIPTGIPVSQVDRSFRGQIDEPRLYDVALSAAEVSDLYAAGASDFAPIVDAGPDLSVAVPTFPLTGAVIDDGTSVVTYNWSASPSAGVVFVGGSTLMPEVTVPGPGSYTFTLTASDAVHAIADQVVVTVGSGGTPAVLAARYDFEGAGAAVEDRVGTSDGTSSGGFARQPTTTGQVGLFDGTAAVAIGDPAALDIAGGIGLTAWVLRDGAGFNPGSSFGRIVSRRWLPGAASGDRGELSLHIFGNHHEATALLSPDSARVRAPKVGSVPRWHHVAASFDPADGTWRMYLDGVQTASHAVGGGAPGTAGDWHLGAWSVYGVLRDYFVGALDEIRIYQGALNHAEIRRLAATDPGNMTPLVTTTPDDPIVIGEPAALGGTVFDDSAHVATWSVVSGPGAVVFADPADPATEATFDTIGDYRLRLEVVDDVDPGVSAVVEIDVEVLAAPAS